MYHYAASWTEARPKATCITKLIIEGRSRADTLERVMNAAAHVVSDTRKFDHDLTRLDVADRVTY